jgi:hypothetical protein
MNEELLKLIEREVLGWAGPFKKWDEDGPVGVTVYELGCKQIGHVHDEVRSDDMTFENWGFIYLGA